METFNTIKVPKNPSIPNHSLKKDSFFVTGDQPPEAPEVTTRILLPVDTSVVLVEEFIGYNGLWSKILILNQQTSTYEVTGYVLAEAVKRINLQVKQSIKPLISSETLPNKNYSEINWRAQDPNVLFSDEKNGKYCVLYDTGLEALDNNLEQVMTDSLYKSVSIILKDLGKKNNIEYVQELQNRYYLFAQAEAIDFSLRNCSTLRVLVTLPKRYARSVEIEKSLKESVSQPADSLENASSEQTENLGGDQSLNPVDKRYIDIQFNNFSEYDSFFKDISSEKTGGIPNGVLNKAAFIYKNRQWIIEPQDVSITLETDVQNILSIREKIDSLIFANVPQEKLRDVFKQNSAQTFFLNASAQGNRSSANAGGVEALLSKELFSWTKPENAIDLLNIKTNWEGRLLIKIDQVDLKIAYMKFETDKLEQIPLNIGVLKFLNDEQIKSKKLVNYILQRHIKKDEFLASVTILSLNFEQDLNTFLNNFHEPRVSVSARPLNITQCVTDFYRDAKNLATNKKQEVINTYKSFRDYDIKQQTKREGDLVLQAIEGYPNNIQNKNLRLILGVEKIPAGTKPFQALNQYILPALEELNLNAIFAEVLKCNTRKTDPQEFAALLTKYNNAKSTLEQIAFATVCNPYLSVGLKKLNGFQLPVIPTYNPNRNIVEELINLVVNIIQEVIVISIRLLLKKSLEACLSDPNKETNPSADTNGNAPSLADAFNEAAGQNDPDINDILDDLFDLDSGDLNALSPEELEQARESAKARLKNLLDNLLCLLTNKEICDLLRGKSVSKDTYDIILSVIRNKEPSFQNKITTNEDILRLFSRLGTPINLNICDELDQARIPSNPLCDDGRLQSAREKLLDSKNLPKEAIDAIIDDLKKDELKTVEDILKFLDSSDLSNQIDFTKIPSVLCQKGPNGEIIPPKISLAPPLESFKSLINSLLKDTYNTFDQEAETWSTTAYSVSESSPKVLKLNVATGKLELEQIPTEGGKDAEAKKEIKPAYLFKDILSNNKYTLYSNNYSYNSNISSDAQEKLDAAVISGELRKQIQTADKNLREFLAVFLESLFFASGLNTINFAAQTIENVYSSNSFLNSIETILSDFSRQIAVFDNFLRSNPNDMDETVYRDLIRSLGPDVERNAMAFEAFGFPLYPKIGIYLKNNQSKFTQVIDTINAAIPGRTIAGVQNVGQFLKTRLNGIIQEFERVEKTYNIVFRSSVNYPSFDITYIENSSSNNIIAANPLVHEKFSLQIDKNLKPYINIKDFENVDLGVNSFINNPANNFALVSGTRTIDKKIIFQNFVRKYNPQYTSVNLTKAYDLVRKQVFSSVFKNIDTSSTFLKKVTVQQSQEKLTDPEDSESEKIKIQAVEKAYVDFLQLVLEGSPTQEQKACGIRPHYLDIDTIKDQMIENKEKSSCIEEIVNEKVRNNQPVNTEEMENLETNDTQNIILSGIYRIAVRIYVHDIILRGIGVFGYYDPQLLRDDSLFIDFITSLTESEIRGVDETFYNMMISFFFNQFSQQNPNTPDTISGRREVLKRVIRQELRTSILPKLSKRIIEDTNNKITSLNETSATKLNFETINLKFIDNGAQVAEQFIPVANNLSLIEISNKVLLRVNGIPDIVVYNGKLSEFNSSKEEFRFLFEYIFPIKREITVAFITNVLCTSTRRQILDAFRGTKKGVRTLAKLVQTNGQPIVPNINNPQDVLNADQQDDLSWFIIKTLFTTPIKIAKGFIEGADPNVALSSGIYKIGKAIEPSFSSFIIPAIGVPLGFWFFSPFMFNPFNIIYYALGLWYEDSNSNEKNKSDEQKRKYLEDLLNRGTGGFAARDRCLTIKDHNDIVKLTFNTSDTKYDADPYYKKQQG